MTQPFRVSTGLKDLIGQGLITNDYVAVFELVKNSLDAHARSVRAAFLADTTIIADDGKGMSAQDITRKWLFVAYSAKSDGTEDLDYRHHIAQRRRMPMLAPNTKTRQKGGRRQPRRLRVPAAH